MRCTTLPDCHSPRGLPSVNMPSPLLREKLSGPVPATSPTLRSIARLLGLSRTTVSDALRGHARVHPETAERVQAAARAVGYVRNPLRGAVMSVLRKSRHHLGCGQLALVQWSSAEIRLPGIQAMIRGIGTRARSFGFATKIHQVSAGLRGLAELERQFHLEEVQGLLLLPAPELPDLSALEWSRYAAVALDPRMPGPHAVGPDHHAAMARLLRELLARGYQRPGLLVDSACPDARTRSWPEVCHAQACLLPQITTVPPLSVPQPDPATVRAWLREQRPDVVLTAVPAVLPWLQSLADPPPGVVCLDHLRTPAGCAALDLRAEELGSRATDLVIAQLLHGDYGLPVHPTLTTLPAGFVDGPSLRPRSEKPLPLPPRVRA